MTIIEALENALAALEASGLKSGDIHDDLSLAVDRIGNKYPRIAEEEL